MTSGTSRALLNCMHFHTGGTCKRGHQTRQQFQELVHLRYFISELNLTLVKLYSTVLSAFADGEYRKY